MNLFEHFIKTKPIIEETEFVNIYKFLQNEKFYKIIIPKRNANRHSIIHCIDDYIAWEQAPLFPRLVGRTYGVKTPIYKFVPEKDCITIFVIKGKPNGIIGLDDGVFKSGCEFNQNFIHIISYNKFKKL